MGREISQGDIDDLLSAITPRSNSESAGDAGDGGRPVARAPLPENARVFDFRRPERFSGVQMRLLWKIHERAVAQLAAHLTEVVHATTVARVASVDQLTYEELVRALPRKTVIGIASMEPLPGTVLIEIDPALSVAFIDSRFSRHGSASRRTPSFLEAVTMAPIFREALTAIGDSWADVTALTPKLSRIETDTDRARITNASEAVLLVTVEATVGDVTGLINLCYPYPVLEPLRHSLAGTQDPGAIPVSGYRPTDGSPKGDREVIWAAVPPMTLERLSLLREGDEIELPELDKGILNVDIGGRPSATLRRRDGSDELFTVESVPTPPRFVRKDPDKSVSPDESAHPSPTPEVILMVRARCDQSERRALLPLVREILDLSAVARRDGLLALEAHPVPDPRLRKAVGFVVDGIDPAAMRETIIDEVIGESLSGRPLLQRLLILQGALSLSAGEDHEVLRRRLLAITGAPEEWWTDPTPPAGA